PFCGSSDQRTINILDFPLALHSQRQVFFQWIENIVEAFIRLYVFFALRASRFIGDEVMKLAVRFICKVFFYKIVKMIF
ncbi:MAG: hypothetical protein QGH39_06065, partial [Candidatus Thermoplasmatota archaeon]|nr:hypothetical protein [Candidatus Thermoplasmatota archaeon]